MSARSAQWVRYTILRSILTGEFVVHKSKLGRLYCLDEQQPMMFKERRTTHQQKASRMKRGIGICHIRPQDRENNRVDARGFGRESTREQVVANPSQIKRNSAMNALGKETPAWVPPYAKPKPRDRCFLKRMP